MVMKYTLKNNKNELLIAANHLHEQRTILFYLLFLVFAVGVLF